MVCVVRVYVCFHCFCSQNSTALSTLPSVTTVMKVTRTYTSTRTHEDTHAHTLVYTHTHVRTHPLPPPLPTHTRVHTDTHTRCVRPEVTPCNSVTGRKYPVTKLPTRFVFVPDPIHPVGVAVDRLTRLNCTELEVGGKTNGKTTSILLSLSYFLMDSSNSD